MEMTDVIREMVSIWRKSMKEMAFSLDKVDGMLKEIESQNSEYNICGKKNQRGYDLETVSAKEYKDMVKKMVDTIFECYPGKYDKKAAILQECYKKMDKEYSASLNLKRAEYVKQMGYAPFSTLDMISDFFGEYLIYKRILLSILEDKVINSAIAPNKVDLANVQKVEEKLENQNVKHISELTPALTWADAQAKMELMCKYMHIEHVYEDIYEMMDTSYNIRWANYKHRYIKANDLQKRTYVDKKILIGRSAKLQRQFVEQFNIYLNKLKETA